MKDFFLIEFKEIILKKRKIDTTMLPMTIKCMKWMLVDSFSGLGLPALTFKFNTNHWVIIYMYNKYTNTNKFCMKWCKSYFNESKRENNSHVTGWSLPKKIIKLHVIRNHPNTLTVTPGIAVIKFVVVTTFKFPLIFKSKNCTCSAGYKLGFMSWNI